MFKAIEYAKRNNLTYYGLEINRDEIEMGDISKISNMYIIKVDNDIESNKYIISFDSFCNTSLMIKSFENIFNEIKNKNKNFSIVDIIKELAYVFKNVQEKDNLKKYIGLLSEIAFIYFWQQKNIDTLPFFQLNDDSYDFSKNKKIIEIKHLNNDKKTIKINLNQLNKIKESNNNLLFVVSFQYACSGVSLSVLKDYLNFSNNRLVNEYINWKIIKLKQSSPNLFEEIKISIDSINVSQIDNNLLPSITIGNNKNDSILVNAKFEISAIRCVEKELMVNNLISWINND